LKILEVYQKDKDFDCCISQNHCKRSSCRIRQLLVMQRTFCPNFL